MKNLFLALALGTGAIPLTAQAQTVTSIQFTRGQYGQGVLLEPGDTAGLDPAANWNSQTTYGSGQGNVQHDWSDGAYLTETNSIGLVTSTGGASPISYSVGSYGNINSGTSFPAGNNASLINGGAATVTGINSPTSAVYNPATLTLNGLTAADTYEFIVYLSGGPSEATEASLSLSGGATYYYLTGDGGYDLAPLTTFVGATQTTDFVAAAGGAGTKIGDLGGAGGPQLLTANYAEFTLTGVTSATLTLNALGTFDGSGQFVESSDPTENNTPVGFAGIQAIDESAAPEPSTWALMAAGVGALVVLTRRGRRA